MKSLFKVFMAAVVIIFAGCQKQELIENSQSEIGKATLTASIGDMTKIGFEDQDAAGLKVTWSAGDKIGLYDVSGNFACVFVLSTGEEGKTKANFTLESGNFDPTKPYTVVYPYIKDMADLTAYAAEKTSRLAADQTQDGATLDHLAGLCFMEGANIASSISFTHTISILTLKLEKPTAADPTEVPNTIGFTNGSKSYNLNITNGNWTNAAYMIIDPIADPGRTLSFDVTTDASNIFNFSVQTDKEYEAGKRYTATLTGGKLAAANFMKFTIDTSKNTADATDKTFIVPFPTGVISGYGFTILWGDGDSKAFSDGATLTQADLTHTYAAAGEYQITIRSTQSDPTQQQIPAMNFGINYETTNNNPKKLISMDTPILNTETQDFTGCFFDCQNLTSVSGGLFNKNTAITSIMSCFGMCVNLTTIPKGLFDRNTALQNFSNCFMGCANLNDIPEGLFSENIEATDFFQCFTHCENIKTIPNGLFDNNDKATTFRGCFSNCKNIATIPNGLFANNTAATNFSNCFNECEKLQLNPNIFCQETPENIALRFAGQTVVFSGCFQRDSFTGIQGVAPKLWEYIGTFNNTDSCFGSTGNSTTSLTNYDDIPTTWGGPKVLP